MDYVVGLARNERLRSLIEEALEEAASRQQQTGRPARVFTEFAYQTLESWSRERRVVGKAEQLVGKQNPRYVVTSLDGESWPPQRLYEQLYCGRGEGENRIKGAPGKLAPVQPVKVRREGKVSHPFHPESWAVNREVGGQALTGARAGRAIEHRKR